MPMIGPYEVDMSLKQYDRELIRLCQKAKIHGKEQQLEVHCEAVLLLTLEASATNTIGRARQPSEVLAVVRLRFEQPTVYEARKQAVRPVWEFFNEDQTAN